HPDRGPGPAAGPGDHPGRPDEPAPSGPADPHPGSPATGRHARQRAALHPGGTAPQDLGGHRAPAGRRLSGEGLRHHDRPRERLHHEPGHGRDRHRHPAPERPTADPELQPHAGSGPAAILRRAMPDPRFFQTLSSLTVAALAEHIGGEAVRGGEVVLPAGAPLSSADRGAIAFLGDRKFAAALAQTKAGCVIVPPSALDAAPADAAVIVSNEAQAAWARASALLHRPIRLDRAITAAEAAEDDTVVVEPGVILGEGVRIGRGSRIGANTVIGPGVQIGRDCLISSGVTVGFALLGDRVKLLAGARIGEAGFGAAGSKAG